MTGDCWPDRLVGTLPHFYYYYIVNPSEAMIAKRRSLATLISYRAPELKKSDLYGDFQELKEMIGEYRESLQAGIFWKISGCSLENVAFLKEMQEKAAQRRIWIFRKNSSMNMKTA